MPTSLLPPVAAVIPSCQCACAQGLNHPLWHYSNPNACWPCRISAYQKAVEMAFEDCPISHNASAFYISKGNQVCTSLSSLPPYQTSEQAWQRMQRQQEQQQQHPHDLDQHLFQQHIHRSSGSSSTSHGCSVTQCSKGGPARATAMAVDESAPSACTGRMLSPGVLHYVAMHAT